MVICGIFDAGNENYREIRGNFPIGRTYPDKQKALYDI